MTLQKQLTLSALVALTLQTTFGMTNQTSLIVVSGLNGKGGENIEIVFPQFPKESIQRAKTPNIGRSDFGQSQCINLLEQTMKIAQDDCNIKNIIIHASSQGTATTLNYTATNSNKIKALILEAPLLSGNRAILHNTYPNSSSPFVHYILPFIAKAYFPFYSPAGQQPIFTCDNLPKDLPIIIIHATQDPELSFDDAQALYAYIKNKGNKNVYFLPIADGFHVNLLKSESKELAVINAILKKHSLPFFTLTKQDVKSRKAAKKNITDLENIISLESIIKPSEIFTQTDSFDLAKYQPNPKKEWLNHFNTLKKRENKIYYLDWCIKGALGGLIFYVLHRTGTIDTISSKISSHI